MEFRELLKNRRSIRRYQDKVPDREIIKEIINEATLAPNAGNEQPWKFSVVLSKEKIKEISDESKRNILYRIENNPEDYAVKYKRILAKESYNVFYNAPVLIFIYGENRKNIKVDCALAASYLMLAAASRGLGTCWINLGADIKDPLMRRELNFIEKDIIVAPIIMGYPDQRPAIPKRHQPIIHFGE